MKRVMVINGPNLNLLGQREPEIYGKITLKDIEGMAAKHAGKLNIECAFFQSNSEGELIDLIHKSKADGFDAIILNAGALTHYSYTLRDAISAVSKPCVEVHLSNLGKREEFRKTSVIAPVCVGSIMGFGEYSYILALEAIANIFSKGE